MRGTSGDSLVRPAAWTGLAAQVIFVASWLVAAIWQGRHYSAAADSISDMYAVTAPNGLFLVVVLTASGVATIVFALFGLWPALRPAGWTALVGCWMLGLSICGIGDALTPFEREACRLADAGCTAADQVANSGGQFDAVLSTIGIFLFIGAAFFLAAAMKRVPGWQRWVRPARWVGFGFFVLLLAFGATESVGLGGLFERLLAGVAAGAIAAAAAHVLFRSRSR